MTAYFGTPLIQIRRLCSLGGLSFLLLAVLLSRLAELTSISLCPINMKSRHVSRVCRSDIFRNLGWRCNLSQCDWMMKRSENRCGAVLLSPDAQNTVYSRLHRNWHHLELVPAFLYSLYLTLYKTETSLRRTLSAGPKGVRLREGWPYFLVRYRLVRDEVFREGNTTCQDSRRTLLFLGSREL